MRSVLIGCVVLLATGLLADGEWFPRNTVFYGKVTNGPEVEELLELPALLIPRERDREQWAMVREKLDPLIAGFESIEIAATDIIPDMDFGVKLNVILTYSTPRDPKLLENMGAKPEVFTTEEYGKYTIRSSPPIQDYWVEAVEEGSGEEPIKHVRNILPPVSVCIAGRHILIATDIGMLKDMLDAMDGKGDAEERLPKNPRFARWLNEGYQGYARIFVDAVNLMKVLAPFEAMLPPEAHGWIEMLGVRKMEYAEGAISYSGADAAIHFSEAPAALKAVPPASQLTTVKYLPTNTVWYMSGSFGELNQTVTNVFDLLAEGERMAAAKVKEGETRERDIFDERRRPVTSNIDDILDDLVYMAFQRAARKLKADGRAEPFTGDINALSKAVKDPMLLNTYLGYAPMTVTNLAAIGEDTYTGEILYQRAGCPDCTLKLIESRADADNAPVTEEEERAIPRASISEVVAAGIDALSAVAGVTREAFSAMVGTNATFGFAPNPTEMIEGKEAFDFDDEQLFIIVEVRDSKKLVSLVESMFMSVPDARDEVLKVDAKGEYHIPVLYEDKDIRILQLSPDGDMDVAVTADAMIFAPCGILWEYLDKKRSPSVFGTDIPSANLVSGFSTQALRNMMENSRVPYFRMPHAQWLIDVPPMTASLNVSSTTVSASFRHPFRSYRQACNDVMLPLVNMLANSSDDNYVIQSAYELECKALVERRADKDPKNDAFRSLGEILATVGAEYEQVQQELEAAQDALNKFEENDSDNDDNARQDARERVSSLQSKQWTLSRLVDSKDHSACFSGGVADNWAFLSNVDGTEANPLNIVALSHQPLLGRTLAVTADRSSRDDRSWDYYRGYECELALRPDFVEGLDIWLKAPADKRSVHDLEMPQVFKLSKAEAKMWLSRHWMRRMQYSNYENEIIITEPADGPMTNEPAPGSDESRKEKPERKGPKKGDIVFNERVGRIEYLIADGDVWKIRVEGFGHSAEIDSEGGITAASWDEK